MKLTRTNTLSTEKMNGNPPRQRIPPLQLGGLLEGFVAIEDFRPRTSSLLGQFLVIS